MERIEFLVLNDANNPEKTGSRALQQLLQQLEKFDLNNAHRFDPNEEFKLRQIMYAIGEDRIYGIKDAIYTVVDRRYRRLDRWEKFISGDWLRLIQEV